MSLVLDVVNWFVCVGEWGWIRGFDMERVCVLWSGLHCPSALPLLILLVHVVFYILWMLFCLDCTTTLNVGV